MKNYHNFGSAYDDHFPSKKIRKSKKKKAKKSKKAMGKKLKKTSDTKSKFWDEMYFRAAHIAVNRMFDMLEGKR